MNSAPDIKQEHHQYLYIYIYIKSNYIKKRLDDFYKYIFKPKYIPGSVSIITGNEERDVILVKNFFFLKKMNLV